MRWAWEKGGSGAVVICLGMCLDVVWVSAARREWVAGPLVCLQACPMPVHQDAHLFSCCPGALRSSKRDILPSTFALPVLTSSTPPALLSQVVDGLSKPNGQQPYLFGGRAQPACTNCKRSELWAQFCQYKSEGSTHGPLCPEDVRKAMLTSWVKRGYELPLTLTPCDLWKHLRGRTLYLMGERGRLACRAANWRGCWPAAR